MTKLKVSARSSPNAVAGAIAGVVREHGCAEVHVIGAGALNQAVKAVAIARGYLAEQGLDLVCVPSFVTLEVDGEQRTAISLVMEDRGPRVALDVESPSDDVVVDDLRIEPDPAPAAAPSPDRRS